jgi:hypothetical protein
MHCREKQNKRKNDSKTNSNQLLELSEKRRKTSRIFWRKKKEMIQKQLEEVEKYNKLKKEGNST